jgi:hypothetical protein
MPSGNGTDGRHEENATKTNTKGVVNMDQGRASDATTKVINTDARQSLYAIWSGMLDFTGGYNKKWPKVAR